MLEFSKLAFDILQQEFPRAEVNLELRNKLFSSSVFDNFHDIRRNLTLISSRTYLSIWHKVQDNAESLYGTISENIDDENAAEYATIVLSTFKNGCGPLAMKVSDVYVDVLEFNGMNAEAKDVRNIQYYDLNVWNPLQVNGDVLPLEAPDKTKVFVTAKTFSADSLDNLSHQVAIAAAFAKFRDTYEMLGMSTSTTKKHFDNFVEEFNSTERKKAVVAKFLKENNGQRIYSFRTFEDLSCWLKEKFEVQLQKDSAEMFSGNTDFTLYLPDNMDFEFFEGYANTIKTESSDLFVDEYNEEAIMMFKDYEAVRDESLMYMATNKMLPLARYKDSKEKERGLRIVQDNLEFLCRFYRRML